MRRHLALGTALSTVLSAAVLSTGCSFALTSGPRSTEKPPKAYPECTTNHTWPVVDAIFGGLFLLSAISIASSANGWQHAPLTWIAPGLARGTLVVPRGEWFDYKVTRGTWETVEKLASCGEASNRYRLGAAGTRIDTVATWRDRCGN